MGDSFSEKLISWLLKHPETPETRETLKHLETTNITVDTEAFYIRNLIS